MSRLAQQHAEVHAVLARRGGSERRAAAARLVAAALRANGLTPAAAGEVERLDAHAWAVQEHVERGSATRQEHEAAFRRARAADAARCLADTRTSWDDTVYEALHGLPAEYDWRSCLAAPGAAATDHAGRRGC